MGIPVKPSVANIDLTLISTWGGVQDRYTTAQRTDGYGAGTTLGRTFASTAKNWENCYWSEWLYRANVAVDYLAQNTELYTDSGAVNTFTLSISSGDNPTSYTDGLRVRFFANNTISGACTANINSLGAKFVKTFSGSALSANQILAGQYVELVYDADNNRFLVSNAILTSIINAVDVVYDNSSSGLTATDVQVAIDEIVSEKAELNGDQTEKFSVANATDDNHAVNLSQFASSLTATGYAYQPSGLLENWGSVSVPANSTTTVVTFTEPFSSACFIVSLTPLFDGTIFDSCITYKNKTKTSVTICNSSDHTTTVDYLAKGK